MAKPTGSNKENFERTRKLLLNAATKCFAENGYTSTSTTEIIARAKSSRGSLYHHFQDKEVLFRAVFDALCQQIVDRIQAYPYRGESAVEDLIDGCIAYLEIFTNQNFAQIILIDGPHVLGGEYCRSKDSETAYKALYEGAAEILKDNQNVRFITDFISGALDTYALRIAQSAHREKDCEAYSEAFAVLAKQVFNVWQAEPSRK